MECNACIDRWKEEDRKPLCKTAEGCPIEAEAKDPTIQRYISGFMRYKSLQRSDAPEAMRVEALRQCGALELCPDFLIAMEPIYNELARIKTEEQEKLAEWRRNDQARVAASQAKARRR